MARTTDASRRDEARRLYAAGASFAEIAAQLGADRRTVQRWCADLVRRPGPRPNPAVTNERIIEMRDVEGLSYAQIATLTALGSWTSARERYRAAKGIARPDRQPG
jgi:alkylhydroperoxidase family enzyme